MEIKDSIIIHGPGKSGTTLLNDILALHPQLFWISTYTNKLPALPVLSILNNFQSIPWIEKKTRGKQNFPRPAEPFNYFSHHITDFRLNLSSFKPEEKMNLIHSLNQVSALQKGERLITKITGPSRSDFLNEIFGSPYVIWIDRDPKSIIASYFKYKWRYKNKLEEFSTKPKKELIREYADYYNWIKKEKDQLKKFKFKRVTYEALIHDPLNFFRELCHFLDLDYPRSFQKTILSWNIRKNTNQQFTEFFNDEEIQYLNSLIN